MENYSHIFILDNNENSRNILKSYLEELQIGNHIRLYENYIDGIEEIKNWIKSIVSGKKKATYGFGEGPQVTSSGKILVGVDELQQMVENGDNIISAEYLENMNIEYKGMLRDYNILDNIGA